jgi:hypothetical protein
MENDKREIDPNFFVGVFAFLAFAAWLLDICFGRKISAIGFAYFVSAFILTYLWRKKSANKEEFLLEVCKKTVVGVTTTCLLVFFSMVFNEPVGDFFLKKYVEGKLIEETRQQQAAGNHQGVLRLTDPKVVSNYSNFTEETLKNIRRVSEDAVTVTGGDKK